MDDSLAPSHDFEKDLTDFKRGMVVFERFQLQLFLGKSQNGSVWLARETFTRELFALKFLPKALIGGESELVRLRLSAQKARRFTHPNIVKMHALLEDDKWVLILMEPVDGDSLETIRNGRTHGVLEPEDLKGSLAQIIETLTQTFKETGILHGNLTPANLIVDRLGNVRIADYGIARAISPGFHKTIHEDKSPGNILYHSPRQLDGERPSEADLVYSLGACLYELLTGKPPFYESRILWKIRHEKPPTITARRKELGINAQGIPEDWEKLIASCLAKTPEDRPDSLLEIAKKCGATPGPFPLTEAQRTPNFQTDQAKHSPVESAPAPPDSLQAAPSVRRSAGMRSDFVPFVAQDDIAKTQPTTRRSFSGRFLVILVFLALLGACYYLISSGQGK